MQKEDYFVTVYLGENPLHICIVCLTTHVYSKSRNGEHSQHDKEYSYGQQCTAEPTAPGTRVLI